MPSWSCPAFLLAYTEKHIGLIFFSLTPAVQSSSSSFSWITSQLQLSKEEEKLIHYLLSSFLPWGLGSRQGAFNSSRRGNHFCVHFWSQLGQSAKASYTTIPQPCKLSLENCALTCHGCRGQAKNVDANLGHFTDSPSPVRSTTTIYSQTRLYSTPQTSYLYSFNSGNRISLLVPLISLSLPWRSDFFCENWFYSAASQTYCRLEREQGTHHPRTPWFVSCCNSHIWHRCSYSVRGSHLGRGLSAHHTSTSWNTASSQSYLSV